MLKENGMLEPGPKKEVADKRITHLICSHCGNEDIYKKVFGEQLKCSKCGELFLSSEVK